MVKDPRLEKVLDLIRDLFADKRFTQGEVRKILEMIQEDIEVRLDALSGDDDRSC
jgi:predicted Zn-dependent peptidase